MGKIEVRVIPHAEYKGKKIIKVGEWYTVKGTGIKEKTLSATTDSIK